jgi:hypothetical protein
MLQRGFCVRTVRLVMEIELACPQCRRAVVCRVPGVDDFEKACEWCGAPAARPSPAMRERNEIDRCARVGCGCAEFFVQRDFSQKVGILVFVIGAALAPWTYYLSLVAAALLDWGLFHLVGDVTICYKCAAHYRGAAPNPAHKAFDLVLYDDYKFGRKS